MVYRKLKCYTTLFYCFYTWLGGNFSEGNTISAANIFMVSCMMPLMKHVNWKQWRQILPMALVCIMLPMVFKPLVYQDLYVDMLLGCLAAYTLIAWFASQHDRSRAVMACGALCVLPLVKESGMAVALMALVVMALDAWKAGGEERKRAIVAIAAALVCVLTASLSWKVFLSGCGVVSEKSFRTWEIAENLRSFLNGTAPGRLKSQYRNFFSHLTNAQMMGGGHILQLSYVEWMLALTLLVCWLKHSQKEQGLQPLRHSRAVAMMMILTAVYAIFLYHTYMYAFPYDEAASLHSFDRYMSTLMLPAVVLGAALAAEKLHRQPPKAIPACLILLTCLSLVVSPYYLVSLTFTAPDHIQATQNSRAKSAPAPFVFEKLKEDDKVVWISAATDRTAFDYRINHYEFLPVQLTKPIVSWDWLAEPPQDVAAEILAGGYTHAYCFHTDEEFVQKYGSLFENPQDIADTTLYEIIRTDSGMMLRKVV